MQRLPPWLFPGLPKAGTKRGFSAGPGLLQGQDLGVLGLHMTSVRTRWAWAAAGPGAACSEAPYDRCQDPHTLSSRRTSRRARRRSREPGRLGTPSVASLPVQAQCPGAQGNGPKVAWSLGRSGLRLSLSSTPELRAQVFVPLLSRRQLSAGGATASAEGSPRGVMQQGGADVGVAVPRAGRSACVRELGLRFSCCSGPCL